MISRRKQILELLDRKATSKKKQKQSFKLGTLILENSGICASCSSDDVAVVCEEGGAVSFVNLNNYRARTEGTSLLVNSECNFG